MSDKIERYAGKSVDVLIRAERCIHARNCVLSRPDVFVPNVDGEWVHPDAASPDIVVQLARNCPSGAIGVERHDGGPGETAPMVNTVRVWENGPYAIHADLSIAGDRSSFRATLCRCGASKKKPYCDGSHHDVSFTATGEPTPQPIAADARRDGPLEIKPAPNGPLLVTGYTEITSGTGRAVARIERTALCRCGGSKNKPYCDGTHAQIGFKAA
jgi:CDGSH-type Zn-finger protein/uncharacterized Fe-S cluster protein YjdI